MVARQLAATGDDSEVLCCRPTAMSCSPRTTASPLREEVVGWRFEGRLSRSPTLGLDDFRMVYQPNQNPARRGANVPDPGCAVGSRQPEWAPRPGAIFTAAIADAGSASAGTTACIRYCLVCISPRGKVISDRRGQALWIWCAPAAKARMNPSSTCAQRFDPRAAGVAARMQPYSDPIGQVHPDFDDVEVGRKKGFGLACSAGMARPAWPAPSPALERLRTRPATSAVQEAGWSRRRPQKKQRLVPPAPSKPGGSGRCSAKNEIYIGTAG